MTHAKSESSIDPMVLQHRQEFITEALDFAWTLFEGFAGLVTAAFHFGTFGILFLRGGVVIFALILGVLSRFIGLFVLGGLLLRIIWSPLRLLSAKKQNAFEPTQFGIYYDIGVAILLFVMELVWLVMGVQWR